MIKNYTSKVSAERSISRIEKKLVDKGAYNIIKLYENKELQGVLFLYRIKGKETLFKLPARVDKVEKKLMEYYNNPKTPSARERIKAQAKRTAWKILNDWIDIQMSLIDLEQLTFMEIFLAHVYDYEKKKTFSEELEEQEYKPLLEFKE